jgi:hypothetical protein
MRRGFFRKEWLHSYSTDVYRRGVPAEQASRARVNPPSGRRRQVREAEGHAAEGAAPVFTSGTFFATAADPSTARVPEEVAAPSPFSGPLSATAADPSRGSAVRVIKTENTVAAISAIPRPVPLMIVATFVRDVVSADFGAATGARSWRMPSWFFTVAAVASVALVALVAFVAFVVSVASVAPVVFVASVASAASVTFVASVAYVASVTFVAPAASVAVIATVAFD